MGSGEDEAECMAWCEVCHVRRTAVRSSACAAVLSLGRLRATMESLSASEHIQESGRAAAPQRPRGWAGASDSDDDDGAPLQATLLRHPLGRDEQHLRVDLMDRV